MNMVKKNPTYQEAMLEGFKPSSSDPDWLTPLRRSAWESFRSLGFPGRKHEAWKYIYLENLLSRPFGLPAPAEKKMPSLERFEKYQNRLVFVGGVFEPGLSSAQSLPFVATDSAKASWASEYFAQPKTLETNPFVFLNTANFQQGVFIRVPKETVPEKPLHVIFVSPEGAASDSFFYPRILVDVEAGSKLELILHHQTLSRAFSFVNSVVECVIHPNANLHITNTQRGDENSSHFFNVRARVEESGRFELVSVNTGGSITRNDCQVDLDGAGAYGAVNGLSVLSGRSQTFQHVNVNHRMTNGTSRQTFKNILADHAAAEFNSMVHVWRCAQKSDSEQLDKNLLLSNDARVYSRPQLKIDNDDVRASHGAATGQLDEKEVFYLQSRGLSKEEARLVLMQGFAEGILQKITDKQIFREQERLIQSEIERMTAKQTSGKKGGR